MAESNQEKGRLTMASNMLGSGALTGIVGPLKDLLEKLGSDNGQIWLSAFKRFLRKENPWMPLKIIRQATIRIGGVSKGALLGQIMEDRSVSAWARDLMIKSAFTTLAEPVEIELGWVTVRDLGFKEEPTTNKLFTRIKEVGDLCPAEVGPHLRLKDKNQPYGTLYWVAMEPIIDPNDNQLIFCVERHYSGECWLDASCANPEGSWNLDDILVFVLR